MTLIIAALKDAVVLIEEAARIEENRSVNGPSPPSRLPKNLSKDILNEHSFEPNGFSDGRNEPTSHFFDYQNICKLQTKSVISYIKLEG